MTVIGKALSLCKVVIRSAQRAQALRKDIMMLSMTVIMAAAMQAPAPAAPSPEAEPQALARAAAVGSAIYAHDRAGWIATDALLRSGLPTSALSGGGWVVEEAGAGSLLVTFYRGRGAEAEAVFTAVVKDGELGATRRLDPAVRLSADQRRLAAARDAAAREVVARGYRPCTPAPFNTVVLPVGKDGAISVYLLSAQTDTVNPLGGHYLVIVGPNGRIEGSRAFMKSCINMKAPDHPKGARPAGMGISSLLDGLPTEIHVYGSYAAGMPLYVMPTDRRLWRVAGSDISLVQPKP